MKLNRIEKFLMNNPVRSLIQRNHEAAMMENFGGKTTGERVLEIGCGRGVGTEIIFERFQASEVHAFDLDPKMVEIAQKRLARFGSEKLKLYVGDAAKTSTVNIKTPPTPARIFRVFRIFILFLLDSI